jgi:hypothetical protein
VINSSPKVVHLAVDFHEDLVQVPFPFAGLHALDTTSLYLGREHRAETVPSEANSFVADFDTALMKQVFNVPK